MNASPLYIQFARRLSLLIVLLFFSFSKGDAQYAIDYAVHANIIYHFTKYINWPENRKVGEFVIGVVGDSPIYDELKKLSNKTAGNQKIVIRRYLPSDDLSDCHILFIAEAENGSLKKIAFKTAGSPVLLVGEEEGMTRIGACVSFTIVSDRLKLEISKKNIESRRLNIATELLQLSKQVN